MDTFLITATYLPRYWSKVLAAPADRVSTIRETIEALGGTLISAYWEVLTSSAWILVELPDSISATAYLSVVLKSGAFTGGEVHELLTQDQFLGVAAVAQSLEGVFRLDERVSSRRGGPRTVGPASQVLQDRGHQRHRVDGRKRNRVQVTEERVVAVDLGCVLEPRRTGGVPHGDDVRVGLVREAEDHERQALGDVRAAAVRDDLQDRRFGELNAVFNPRSGRPGTPVPPSGRAVAKRSG